jgi:hypothetical protein
MEMIWVNRAAILAPMIKRILIATFLILLQASAMALEEPEYTVIGEYGDFELRQYAPYLIAEVDVDGDFDEAGNSAFRILAGYIFGDNQASEKMAMTAPVESRPGGKGEKMSMTAPVTTTNAAGQTTYAFVMERKYSMETLPVPNDERIRILEVPERTMAVRRYSGRWTEEKYAQNEAALRTALSDHGIQIIGEPVLARYNSPFSLPMLRRNEVMFEVIGQDNYRAAHRAHLSHE